MIPGGGGLSISETAKLSDILPIPLKFGFSFAGWYEDADLMTKHPISMPNHNLTLYAKWNDALSLDGSVSTFKNGTDHPWHLDISSSDFIYESSNYDINDSKSQFSATVSGTGKLYFMYSVSSEESYDKLSVTLDGQETSHIYSGEVPWTLGYLDIAGEGDHTITWTYSKDGSSLNGDDKARIKELSFIPEGSIKNLNIDINVNLPAGYDVSSLSITGLTLGSNTLQAGTESTVTVSYEGLVFIGWKNENGSWLLGDGVNECIENTLSFTNLHDSSLTAVFVINEPILPEIAISQDDQESIAVTNGMELVYSSFEGSNTVFTLTLMEKYSDVNVAISLNGTDVAYSGNTCVLQNITNDSELVFTAVRSGYLTQTLTLYFKPISLISDICTDGSVTSIYSFGDYRWSLDNTIPNRVAYKSNNQLIDTSLSSLAIEVVGSGILCFDYCVSSESKYDSLLYNINQEITLDNKNTATNYDQRSNYSGDIGWISGTIIISAADFEKTTIYFAYCKDGSGENGQDTAWISNVRFVQGLKTITFNEPDQSTGTISGTYAQSTLTFGGNEVSTGIEVLLNAVPNAGYQFYGWSDNGNLISLSTSCSFIVLDNMSINAVFALENTYAARNGGTWYTSLEEALNTAKAGDTVVLLKDYTITQDLTIPQGVMLVLPCSNEDNGYDLTAAYEGVHNPDGTSTNKADISVLYRTLTIPSNVVLTVEGQVLVNAVTGRPSAGHFDMDITGNYSQILLDGNILVENGAILEVCGYIKGNGQVTAKNGSDIRDTYVVKNWRGGSQASSMYFKDIFPFNEYDCNNIQCTLYMESSASLSGNVKMYASGSYHYTRFPQIDQVNGLIRLTDGAYLIKTYDVAAINGTAVTDVGRTTIQIYGGSAFSSSTLKIVGMDLSTSTFIYPVDGDISLELHSGDYIFNNNFKFMTGASMAIYEDATLTLPEGKTVIFYDEFVDVDNTSTTEYPERSSAVLLLKGSSEFTLNGTFAGIVKCETSTNQVRIGLNAVTVSVTTNEANGYQNGTRELTFNLQIQDLTA